MTEHGSNVYNSPIFRGVAPSEVAAGIDMLLAERAACAGQTPEEGQN